MFKDKFKTDFIYFCVYNLFVWLGLIPNTEFNKQKWLKVKGPVSQEWHSVVINRHCNVKSVADRL